MKDDTTRLMTTFLLGAAAGGLAGLLLAPSSGEELRRKVGDGVDKARDDARRRAKEMGERVNETYDAAADGAREMAGHAWATAEAHRTAVKRALEEGIAAYENELGKEH